jgi:hypothetical protein
MSPEVSRPLVRLQQSATISPYYRRQKRISGLKAFIFWIKVSGQSVRFAEGRVEGWSHPEARDAGSKFKRPALAGGEAALASMAGG